MDHLIGFVLGIGATLLGAFILKMLENSKIERHERSALKRIKERPKFPGTVSLGNFDLGVYLTAGYLGGSYGRDQVEALHIKDEWAPEDGELEKAVAERVKRWSEEGGRKWYNGNIFRLTDVWFGQDEDDREEITLTTQPTKYFRYLATNYGLGPFVDVDDFPYVNDSTKLGDAPLANALTVDVTLITCDGLTPIMQRASKMPIAGGCWQTSIGETVEDMDADGKGNINIFEAARRGLWRELAIEGYEIDDNPELLAVVIDPNSGEPGLLMRAQLTIDAAEVEERLKPERASESWEFQDSAWIRVGRADQLAEVLTDGRPWLRRPVASLVFAHAYEQKGKVDRLEKALAGKSVEWSPYRTYEQFMPLTTDGT